MNKHPDCAEECQQAVDYGVWPERSCSPECVWLKRFAKVGDRVQCEVRFPMRRTLTMILETPEAVAHANELLADKSSGWRLA